MICAIHQPNFLPYLGFFHKAKNCDIFIFYDNAQYSKNEYHNRNKIKTSNGPIWLTIPVSINLGQKINEAEIANTDFINKHLASIKYNYSQSQYFDQYFPKVEEIYSSALAEKNLFRFNIKFLQFIFDILDIKAKILNASDLGLNPEIKSTEAIIELCKKAGADEYLSGSGAHAYLKEELFKENGIDLKWHSFEHPAYDQLWGGFLPNMCILDVIFHLGPEAKRLIS